MRRLRALFVPFTIAWFAGAFWWLGHRGGCGCDTPVGSTIAPSVVAASITMGPVVPGPTVLDPLLLQPLAIPFVKNTQEPGATDVLARYAGVVKAALLADPEAAITITGHTDADGDTDLNRRLSSARAELVKAELVGLGVPATRIRTAGMGADQPVSDNITSKGKAMNRRVEITFDRRP